MSGETAAPEADVVSASVQSLVRRLGRYPSDTFDLVIVDEAHHAVASSYQRILDHFHPRLTLGFTATPNRTDGVRLGGTFSEIIFDRDLRWGIENGWLSDIYCRRVDIGYDLRGVHSQHGDYAPGELEEAMEGTADAVAEAYSKMAVGATLIFAVSVRQAQEIASRIPGAVVVTGETKERKRIVEDFTTGKISCLVNCMVFTEGTDIPRVETVMIARPTQSDSLYTQMVGRGLRPFEGKKVLNLIDCVGVTGTASLCTAPTLMGLSVSSIPENRQSALEGLLFELPDKAAAAADCPECWIKNIEIVDLWAKGQKYITHNVNWFKQPDGTMTLSLLSGRKITIPPPDELGRVRLAGKQYQMQEALDMAYQLLCDRFSDQEPIWNLAKVRRWGSAAATEKQTALIRQRCAGMEIEGLTKLQASQVLNRIMAGGKVKV